MSNIGRRLAPGVLGLAALLCACSGEDAITATPTPTYSQSDLAGSWDFVSFQTGAQLGWERGTASIDAAGAVTTDLVRSDGSTGPGDPFVLQIAPATGELTQTVGVATAFHGTLAKDKRLLAAVSTPVASTYDLTIARKRQAGLAYSDADIRGKTFALQALRSGGNGEWRYGTGSISAGGVVTVDTVMGPTPGLDVPAPNGRTLSVTPAGLVSDGAGFEGFLTTDKNTLVSVFTDPTFVTTTYQITILQFTGGAFTQADLTGEHVFNSLGGNVQPVWFHGSLGVSATGVATYRSDYVTSDGEPVPSPFQLALAADGTITVPSNGAYRGTMSLTKDTYVRTTSHGVPGRYGISIVMKR